MRESRVALHKPVDVTPEDYFYAVIDLGEPYRCEALEYLAGAEFPGFTVSVNLGATYKSLAYIGHRLGMDAKERMYWYKVAEQVGLSQAHAGIIIARLNERDALFEELDNLALA